MSLLITGGAGAVGSMAIQMAKAARARVITTVSSDEKAAAATEDGADAVVNYKTEPVADAVLAANDGRRLERIVDVDFASHVNDTPRILKPGGCAMVVDMVAHDREVYLHTMGHQHLGFDETAVRQWAEAAGMADVRYRRLRADTDAKGPGLFVATMKK